MRSKDTPKVLRTAELQLSGAPSVDMSREDTVPSYNIVEEALSRDSGNLCSQEVSHDKTAHGGNGLVGGMPEPIQTGVEQMAQHTIIARRMMAEYYACYVNGVPAIWSGAQYLLGWDNVESLLARLYPNSTRRLRAEVLDSLRLLMPRQKASDERYIGFSNGVFDLNSDELIPLSPDLRVPNIIPHAYNPNARSEYLDEFLAKIACGNAAVAANLREFTGLSMYRGSRFAYAAFLLGKQQSGGRASNGKSTFLHLIQALLGPQNYSAIDLAQLGDNFMTVHLLGQLANIGADVTSEFIRGRHLSVFKKAVSGDAITCDQKNRRAVTFCPYSTIFFAGNSMIRAERLDEGVLRRLHIIPFYRTFRPTDSDYDAYADVKLEREEVVEAAIIQGIAGLKRLIAQNGPTENPESQRLKATLKIDNDNILQWIEDGAYNEDAFTGTEIAAMYQQYETWADQAGIRNRFTRRAFTQAICGLYGFRSAPTTRGHVSMRVFAK